MITVYICPGCGRTIRWREPCYCQPNTTCYHGVHALKYGVAYQMVRVFLPETIGDVETVEWRS